MRSAILPLILLVSLLAGCASQPPQRSSTSSTARVDLETFEGFGQALEQTMQAKDTSLFVERVDTQQFARRSLASFGLSKTTDDTVNTYAGFLQKALNQRYKETFSQVKSAHFVRLMPADSTRPDEAVCLIRIQPEGGGINYWKVYLRRANGHVSIVDWFSYSMGDLASRSLGSFALQVGIAATEPNSDDADTIKAYLAAAQNNDFRKQMDTYRLLPARLKSNSLLMFAHTQAAMKVSEEVYRNALAELAPLYRKNTDYALILVDYYLFNEEYGEAQRAVDTVAVSVGEDAGLDSLRAGIALQEHNYENAIAYARDGIKREAGYEDNYWVLLEALVYSENYIDAVLVLNILEKGFNYRFDARQMAALEGYETFSRSEAFTSWRSASAH